MNNYKSMSYKYNSRTKRYTIQTSVTPTVIKLTTNMLGNRGKLLFSKQKNDSFEIYEFFLLELEYLLNQVINGVDVDITILKSISGLRDVLDFIREKTWVYHRYNKVDVELDISSITRALKFKPMPHQYSLFNKYESIKELADLRGLMFDSAAGTGKALKNGTLVKTPSGWLPIENLKVGDLVIGRNGLPTKVNGVYPQGKRKLVRLLFKDGRHRDCDLDHLWNVKVSGMTDKYRTMKTSKILKHLDDDKVVRIPLFKPTLTIEKNSKFKLHPYILGVILNNESLRIEAHIESSDPHVLKRVTKLLPPKHRLVLHKGIYDIVSDTDKNIVVELLREYTLYKKHNLEKKIPLQYLEASISDRLYLLQGLLDTGGKIDRNNTLYYKTNSYALSISLRKLMWSLGDTANIDVKDITYGQYNIESLNKDYEIIIRAKDPRLYMSLPSIIKILNKQKYSKIDTLNISGYTIIPEGDATCIAVDAKDKLFVIEDYIVTHNTYMSLAMTESLHYDRTVIIVPKAVIDRVWVKSLKEELYKTEQSICMLGNGDKEYNGEKFLLTHYEYIPKLIKNTKILRQLRMYKPNMIIDEFHNFNEIDTERTENLLKLVNTVNFRDIFLLTGTPIKMTLKELVPMLYILDEKFPKVKDIFVNFYRDVKSEIFKNLIRYRFDNYRERIEKDDDILPPIDIEEYELTLPKSDKYLLDNITKRVVEYKKTRLKEIMDNLGIYTNTYNLLLTEAKNNLLINNKKYTIDSIDKLFKEYESKIKIIHKSANDNTLKDIPEIVLYVKDFDNDIILPNISNKKLFRDVRTIIKYPKYKVLGEALGKIILGTRIECYKELATTVDYDNILKMTDKKVLIFSNYVSVSLIAIDKCKNKGYNPLGVFGEHIPNLSDTVSKFMDINSGINPLVATYKSLSTGVPITVANVVLCLDIPFRSYLFDQAVSRVHRIGQSKKVYVLLVKLDTGSKHNITERDLYILNTSDFNVEAITGNQTPYDLPIQEIHPEDLDEEIDVNEIEEEVKEIVLESVSKEFGISKLSDFLKQIKNKIIVKIG